MSVEHDELVAELIAERHMSSDQIWKAAEARLDWPISNGLNTDHEARDRWAGDRGTDSEVVVTAPDEPATLICTNLACPEKPTRPGALTSVVPRFDVELADEDGVTRQGQGILALSSPRYQAASGYRSGENLWAARWRGRKFLTGDTFRQDSAGRYWFTGRSDDLIVTAGYNVGPTEVAGMILAQLATEIREYARDKLGRHAYPRIIDFVSELPKTETGKIKRNLLGSPSADQS